MTRTREISNSDDIIDSRDIIARIRELENDDKVECNDDKVECAECEGHGFLEHDQPTETAPTCPTCNGSGEVDNPDFMEEEAAELKALKDLEEEASGSADWRYGETLIRDSYFETYARDMASDIYGKEIDDARWPFDHIDWSAAAEALQADYTSVDFDGVTYWIRS